MGLDSGEQNSTEKTKKNSESTEVNFTPNIADVISSVEVQKDEQNKRVNPDSEKEKKPETNFLTQGVKRIINAAALGYQENKTNPEKSSTTQLAEKLKDISDQALKTLAEILNNLDELLKDNKTRVAIIIALIPLITTACGNTPIFYGENLEANPTYQQQVIKQEELGINNQAQEYQAYNQNETNPAANEETIINYDQNQEKIATARATETYTAQEGSMISTMVYEALEKNGYSTESAANTQITINRNGQEIIQDIPYSSFINGGPYENLIIYPNDQVSVHLPVASTEGPESAFNYNQQ